MFIDELKEQKKRNISRTPMLRKLNKKYTVKTTFYSFRYGQEENLACEMLR